MKLRLPIVGLAVILVLCVVLFRTVLFSASADAVAEKPPRQVIHDSLPPPRSVSVSHASPEIAAEPTAAPEAPAPAVPSSPAVELTPDMENARLRRLINDSGAAAGDVLDRSSHEIANDLVTRLRSHDAAVTLQAMDCKAAGCTATLEVAAEADYFRLHTLFDGLDRDSPLARWPGSRIMPPVTRHNDRLLVSIMLIRPDSRVSF